MDFCPNNSLKLPSRGSHKRGRLVEWVEKASFDRLNKLFKITTIERHHQTLLSARNLLAVVQEPQPYVLNIFLRQLPKVVVPGEHFVLKDLPFYEKAREEDAKACQERLDQWEEKSRSGSPAQALEDNSSSSQLDTINLGTGPSQPQPEFIGLRVVNDPKEEEDINDLRTRFLERHRKWLHEAIDIVPPPAKRACPEKAQEDPAGGASLSNVLHSDEAGPSTVAAIQPDVATPSNAPTAEEEAHGTKAGQDVAVARELWMRRVSVNMGGDPPTFVSAWLPFGTPESVVSCIQHLQEWMVPKTAEVVVVGIRYMMRTHAQLFKRLEVAEAMRAFISHHPGDIEEMRLKLEMVENDLAAA
uniref:Uncharacterized protein n=1 Tax=Vitis vinifera TaxID=29760 RepID=A5BWV6_VITVI|nr:hypothetical protein VITISV_025818 [Vitis vinifera]